MSIVPGAPEWSLAPKSMCAFGRACRVLPAGNGFRRPDEHFFRARDIGGFASSNRRCPLLCAAAICPPSLQSRASHCRRGSRPYGSGCLRCHEILLFRWRLCRRTCVALHGPSSLGLLEFCPDSGRNQGFALTRRLAHIDLGAAGETARSAPRRRHGRSLVIRLRAVRLRRRRFGRFRGFERGTNQILG